MRTSPIRIRAQRTRTAHRRTTQDRSAQKPPTTVANVPQKRQELTTPTTTMRLWRRMYITPCPWQKIDRRQDQAKAGVGATHSPTLPSSSSTYNTVSSTCVQNVQLATSQLPGNHNIVDTTQLHLFRNKSHKSCKYVTYRSIQSMLSCCMMCERVFE